LSQRRHITVDWIYGVLIVSGEKNAAHWRGIFYCNGCLVATNAMADTNRVMVVLLDVANGVVRRSNCRQRCDQRGAADQSGHGNRFEHSFHFFGVE